MAVELYKPREVRDIRGRATTTPMAMQSDLNLIIIVDNTHSTEPGSSYKPAVCCKPGVSCALKAKAGAIMGGVITLVGVVKPTPRFRLGGMLVCKDNSYTSSKDRTIMV